MNPHAQPGRSFREASFVRSSIANEDRTVEIAFSSENPVSRGPWVEVLSHAEGAVDLSRLNGGAALLLDHDPSKQIGVVTKAWVDTADKMGRATVRFSRGPLGEEIFQDVKDGIRSLVSVGYEVKQWQRVKEENGVETFAAVLWQPIETSIVSIPADASVGVGRGDSGREGKLEITKQKMTPPNITAERERVAEIYAIANKYNVAPAEVERAVNEGHDTATFGMRVLELRGTAKVITTSPMIGMSDSEIRQFSLVEAINDSVGNKGKSSGMYREISDQIAKQSRRTIEGFAIPHDVLMARSKGKRDLTVGDATKGGYLVATQQGDMIELLRNATLANQLGVRFLSGLQGNVAIPRQTGGATVYWLDENGQGTKTDQSFDQITLSPKRLFAATAFSKQLLAQSPEVNESFVRGDLMQVLAIEQDRVIFNGTGTNGQPRGILNTTGIKTLTFGGAATYAKYVNAISQVGQANALEVNPAFLLSWAAWEKGITTVRFANTDRTIISEQMTIAGAPVKKTNQLPSNRMIYGHNFSDLIVGEWAGMDVVVDPFTLADTGKVKVTIQSLCDVQVRHPETYCASTDSAAQ